MACMAQSVRSVLCKGSACEVCADCCVMRCVDTMHTETRGVYEREQNFTRLLSQKFLILFWICQIINKDVSWVTCTLDAGSQLQLHFD